MIEVFRFAKRVDDACSYALWRARVQLGALVRVIHIMMMRHRRWPAIGVLVVMIAIGAIYVRSWGRGAGGNADSLASLEKQITRGGNIPAATWNNYAQKLMEAKRFSDAASAYKKVLEKEPANRTAKTGAAIALAKAQNEEEFYKFMSELTYSDPKMAMDIFDRGECQAWLGQTRFKTLQHEARAQAMD
ncbi:MAG TPA: tetratricopeptide repeat protein [Tepidisphaeraceae bacterium]|jgi:tetratricopeptide (TPR) repeat protein|nr:tetratricopeptide repeat protein [Tepidisphaeraceae bacterium]